MTKREKVLVSSARRLAKMTIDWNDIEGVFMSYHETFSELVVSGVLGVLDSCLDFMKLLIADGDYIELNLPYIEGVKDVIDNLTEVIL